MYLLVGIGIVIQKKIRSFKGKTEIVESSHQRKIILAYPI